MFEDNTKSYPVEQYRAYLNTQAGNSRSDPKATPGRRRVVRQSPEEDLQRTCMEWVSLMQNKYPVLNWIFHAPNGGKRPRGEAGKLKAMGVKKGFPDLFLPKVCGQWMGLAIELKSPTGKTSPDQDDWLCMLQGQGYLCAVCRTFTEFEARVLEYLMSKPQC